MPPLGPARTGLAAVRAQRAEYVVLTCSDEMLEQVGVALDGAGEVRHADTEEDARQLVDDRHATVILLDAREQVDPGLVVERLHVFDGSTVIVVFAPSDAMESVAKAIKGSAAFAVLPIPIELDKTRAVLQGAGEEALARLALISPAATVAPVQPVTDPQPHSTEGSPDQAIVAAKLLATSAGRPASSEFAAPPAAIGGTPRAPGRSWIVVGVVVALLVAVTGAWLYLGDDAVPAREVAAGADGSHAAAGPVQRQPSAQGAAISSAVPLSTAPLDELLDRARVAIRERRYTDPDRDNALYYYRSVLARDPQDAEAREGVERVGAVLDGRLKSALAERRADDAARTLQQLRSIRPDDTALAAVEVQLAEQRVGAALSRGDAEQASELLRAAVVAGVPPDRLAPLREQLARLDASQRAAQLSAVVRARIRDGQLLTPPGDSAKHHLDQLLKMPNGKRLGADVQAELAREFADRAQLAAAQGQGDEAARWLAEARALGFVPERRSAGSAPTIAATAAAQGTPVVTPDKAAPASVSREVAAALRAQSVATAEPEPSAADFRRTRYVAPVYPSQALARGQPGEVRVRITVDTEGRVARAQVVSASPAGVFEQAAVSAVRKWRFEPVTRDGRAIEASVVTTIRFQPDAGR